MALDSLRRPALWICHLGCIGAVVGICGGVSRAVSHRRRREKRTRGHAGTYSVQRVHIMLSNLSIAFEFGVAVQYPPPRRTAWVGW